MQTPDSQSVTSASIERNWPICYPQKLGCHFLSNDETNQIMPTDTQLNNDTWPNWLYTLNWQDLPHLLPIQIPANLSDHWLVLADKSGYGQGMAQYLSYAGHRVTLAFAASNRFTVNDQSICLVPTNTQHWQQLLDYIDLPTNILHFWSLDVEPLDLADQPLGCEGLITLLKVLVKRNIDSAKVWVFTQLAQAVTVEQPTLSLSQTPFWGLARTIALEMPQLWGGIIDLDTQTNPTETAPLVAACLGHPLTKKQLALRQGQVYAVHWQKMIQPEPTERNLGIRADGTYLVTGGLGELGLHLAMWLAQQGARQILLLNRTTLPPRKLWQTLTDDDVLTTKVQVIQRLEAMGVTVHLGQVDVADFDQAATFLTQFRAAGGLPIRGIIHAAGVLQPQSIMALSTTTWRETLASKVSGSWHLHILFQNQPLDFFILFSSISAVLGATNLAAYAAGNTFLDGLAHYRHKLGLPALAINWGPWKSAGMAVEQAAVFKAYGIEPLSIAQNLTVFNQIWHQPKAQVGVMATTAQFLGNDESTTLSSDKPSQASELTAYLTQCLQSLLPQQRQQLTADDSLLELGFDSITAMALTHRLSQDYGRQFYPQDILQRPSLGQLAQYLTTELNQATPAQVATTPFPDSSSTAPLPRSRTLTKPNPSAIFILSAPRSGSTLLRTMLAGHSDLFCPPELNLLPFTSLAERAAALRSHQLDQGLPRALMTLLNLDATQSQAVVQGWQQTQVPIQTVYQRLQALAAPATLVDKSPLNSLNLTYLERTETLFSQAKYIHLIRHPQAVMKSFVDNRLAQIFGVTQAKPSDLAEQVWHTANQNIQRFAAHISPNRYYLVSYETLVTTPEIAMRGLCQFLEIPYQAALLTPYDASADDPRMLKGLYPESPSLGDPNFLKHNSIEASLAQRQVVDSPRLLQQSTAQLAAKLGYSLRPQVTEASPAVLSFAQQRLWILEQLGDSQMRYHVPAGFFRITGMLNQPALLEALQHIVDRHEALRATISVVDGLPQPVVQPPAKLEVNLIDLTLEPEPERTSQAVATQLFEVPFSLEQGPLLRAQLVRLAEGQHDLHLVIHHLVADGWSLMIIFQELVQLYQAALKGTGYPLPPLTLDYFAFVNQQQSWLNGPVAQQQRAYWLTELKEAPAMLKIPIDMPRSGGAIHQGGVSHLTLVDTLPNRLWVFASQHQTTPFAVVLTALTITLYQWAKQPDMVIGTVATGRTNPESANLVGCLMNFLPLRLSIQPGMTGRELLALVEAKTREAQANQDFPFEKVVDQLQPQRTLHQNPFYNVAFIWQKFSQFSQLASDVTVEFIPLNTATANLDLRFILYELADKMLLRCEFRSDLFWNKTINHLLATIVQNLAILLDDPDMLLNSTTVTPASRGVVPEINDAIDRPSLKIVANFDASVLADSLHFWRQSLDLMDVFDFTPPAANLVDMLAQISEEQSSQPTILLVRPDKRDLQGVVAFIEKLRSIVESTTNRYLLAFGPSQQSVAFELPVTAAFAQASRFKIIPSTVWDKRDISCCGEAGTYTTAFYATLGTKIIEQIIGWEVARQ